LRESGPLVLEHGEGVRLYHADGKDYIEAIAGLWCTSSAIPISNWSRRRAPN
jgi:adenosylmethionine-8-amino-7-oxononanoate aminotransferase